MAFREIDPEKLAFLLAQGTHEGELKKFFTESRTQLLLKGAKVQNLPHGREERVRAICEKLPRKTDDVVRAWFQNNVSIAAPASLDEVLMYLEAYFDENEPLPETEAKMVCRSALVYLFDDETDTGLFQLLQRPLGPLKEEKEGCTSPSSEQPSEPEGESDPSTQAAPPEDIPVPQSYHLAELIAALISGDEDAVDNALVPFADSTRVLVEALLRLRAGDAGAAREQLSLLRPDGPESELVQSALTRARHQQTASVAPAGIRALIPQPLSGDPDTHTYEVVGVFTNESDTGAIFVQPLFLVLGGQLRHLSKEDRIRLFPESGSVMTHKPALRKPLGRRELVHWSVSERDGAEGRTRFHMETELSPLIEVVRIPVPSNDSDEVRFRIKAYADAGRTRVGQQMMFVLSDGVAVASPKGADLTRERAFDQPWQAWVSLETWLIEGHQYCLDVSHGAASHLDLSPLDAAFRRLLKNLEAECKLTISKAQRRELAELLRSHSGDEVAQRARRIAASLDQISINEEELEVVLGLLGSHAEVHRRVDELVTREFEERQAEKAGLQEEISALKKKKTELEEEGREIERQNRARADSVAASVRGAFARAIREGTEMLANAEIFQLLTNPVRNSTRQETPVTGFHQADHYVKRGALSATDVKERLRALGMNGRQAIVLSALSEVTRQSGVALVLKGSLARQCVQTLVRQDRDAVAIVDIPMGLTSSDFLRQLLCNLAEVNGFAFLNADLSPFEIYGAELLDLLIEQATSKGFSPRPILMSCLDGDLSLPLPSALRRVSLVVDLDSTWDEGQLLLDDVDPDAILLLPTLLRRIAEVISGMDDSVCQHVSRALAKAVDAE